MLFPFTLSMLTPIAVSWLRLSVEKKKHIFCGKTKYRRHNTTTATWRLSQRDIALVGGVLPIYVGKDDSQLVCAGLTILVTKILKYFFTGLVNIICPDTSGFPNPSLSP